MNAKIVLGLGWGDEGKGTTVDYLCSQSDVHAVVRFSGGQQAGHTVIKDGIKHVFSNYGSGSLRGIPTYFSEHTTFYLNTMATERAILSKHCEPRLVIHPLAMVTTPYDVAANRMKDKGNPGATVGLGIGMTMHRNAKTGYKFYAMDMLNTRWALNKLMAIRQWYDNRFRELGTFDEFHQEYKKYEEEFIENMRDKTLFEVEDYSFLWSMEDKGIVFEGSQGILLDMDHGIFPDVTYANTTSKNAIDVLNKLAGVEANDTEVYYVTRCYQTRHGNGWMSNNKPIKLVNNQEEINKENPWQGTFKTGEIDYDLINHALKIDRFHCPEMVKKHLVVTCLDQRPGFEFNYKMIETDFESVLESTSAETRMDGYDFRYPGDRKVKITN